MDVEYSYCRNNLFEAVWVGGSFTNAAGGSAWNLTTWTNSNGVYMWDVAPTPAFLSPTQNQQVSAPVSVVVSLAGTGCSVNQVQFFEGNRLLATETSGPPYSFSWSSRASGWHTIVAVATDSRGRVAFSSSVSFTVQ